MAQRGAHTWHQTDRQQESAKLPINAIPLFYFGFIVQSTKYLSAFVFPFKSLEDSIENHFATRALGSHS